MRAVLLSIPIIVGISSLHQPYSSRNGRVTMLSKLNNGSNSTMVIPDTSLPLLAECGRYEQKKLHQCTNMFYKSGIVNDVNITWIDILESTEHFNEMCDNIFVFDMCIEPYKHRCFDEDEADVYDSVVKVFHIICQGGYGEILRNFGCFTRTLTRAEMRQCEAEMIANIGKIPDVTFVDKKARQAAICGQTMQNYIDCIRYPIRYECGYRTWIVVREIIVGPVRVLLPQCGFSISSTH
ncbi:hypothetical protein Angca_000217 [Angiostrongylus cantonensis]|nr:hypothetical protein Angca_000217 [Angiostrongylus cantonensis]